MTVTDFRLSDGRRAHLIGDPHLGKKFEEGVPQHRRGERELSQATEFSNQLESHADIIVMVGDLFDNPYVSDAVIVAAARTVLSAAARNESTLYVMMAGNHDKPRNLTTVGAWHAFREMTQGRFDNLIVLDQPYAVAGIAFFPWEWDRRADDQVADIAHVIGVEHAIGHWDLSVFDGKDDHLAPTQALAEAWPDLQAIWSGHYHKPGAYPVGEHVVQCVGSMQPYAHGEGDMYVTLTRAEVLARDDLYDKCVRVILAPGEELPEIDCLMLTHKRVRGEAEDEVTVSLGDFDFHQIVRASIQDRDVRVRTFIEERMPLNVSAEEQR